jgi:glutathione S-transferase
MADYTLHYWPLPFRGQFVRAVLAWVGATCEEPGADEVVALMSQPPVTQGVPFMAPPVLEDHGAGVQLSQLVPILLYLGGKHGLLPDDPGKKALSAKLAADANDVLSEITRFGGREMWTRGEWDTFCEERLSRWMQIFEALGTGHGLTRERGTMLGTDAPGLADLVSATLWGTLAHKMPEFEPMLAREAPCVAAHAARLQEAEPLKALQLETDTRFGQAWCGGLIEASIREMLTGPNSGPL